MRAVLQNQDQERRVPARVLLVDAGESIARHCLDTLCKVDRLDPKRVLSETSALEKMNSWHPQLLIVGDTLAGQSGLEFCSKIREHSTVPLIFLTSHPEMQHQIRCLNTGADDCITVPFEAPLLIGRVLCLLRRSYRYSRPPLPDAPRGVPQFKQPGHPR
jgi:DNA-binding response OmpR family regulator